MIRERLPSVLALSPSPQAQSVHLTCAVCTHVMTWHVPYVCCVCAEAAARDDEAVRMAALRKIMAVEERTVSEW